MKVGVDEPFHDELEAQEGADVAKPLPTSDILHNPNLILLPHVRLTICNGIRAPVRLNELQHVHARPRYSFKSPRAMSHNEVRVLVQCSARLVLDLFPTRVASLCEHEPRYPNTSLVIRRRASLSEHESRYELSYIYEQHEIS